MLKSYTKYKFYSTTLNSKIDTSFIHAMYATGMWNLGQAEMLRLQQVYGKMEKSFWKS